MEFHQVSKIDSVKYTKSTVFSFTVDFLYSLLGKPSSYFCSADLTLGGTRNYAMFLIF